MRVGFVGLGKLGLPVAAAIASRGVEVVGWDIRPEARRLPDSTDHEDGLAETLHWAGDRLRFTENPADVVATDVVFVAVQTPHEPRFEGVTPLPDDRADFDYTALRRACADIAQMARHHKRRPTVAVISTVLPGTMVREIRPVLGDLSLVYSPSFIAMGTTIRDFLSPEFVLIGGDDGRVGALYDEIGVGPLHHTSIENAELTKVAYNTFIGLKLAFANTLQEVCHKLPGCDVDEVTDALKKAHRRLISPAYLEGGMGDGGACHPRDNIALSWLARELDLSFDLFEAAMLQRERHAEWLADLMCEYALPKGILGLAYKPGSHILTGSPAKLVESILRDRGYELELWDPYAGVEDVDGLPTFQAGGPGPLQHPRVYLVGCRHPKFAELRLPEGSVVIDPWRYIPDQPGVEVIRVGLGPSTDDGQAREGRWLGALAA